MKTSIQRNRGLILVILVFVAGFGLGTAAQWQVGPQVVSAAGGVLSNDWSGSWPGLVALTRCPVPVAGKQLGPVTTVRRPVRRRVR